VIRESGLYATRDSQTFQVAYRAGRYVAPYRFEGEPHLADLVPISELTALERITVTAEWQGTRVVVDRIRPSHLVWVRTNDVALAERLELYGSLSTGWGTAVRLYELEDIREEVMDLLA
jgi:hypothetical protein